MSGNDFWGGLNGTSWNPNDPNWRMGDQMRRNQQQQDAFHKQQMERLSKPSGSNYSGTPIELGARAKKIVRLIQACFSCVFILAIITITVLGWW